MQVVAVSATSVALCADAGNATANGIASPTRAAPSRHPDKRRSTTELLIDLSLRDSHPEPVLHRTGPPQGPEGGRHTLHPVEIVLLAAARRNPSGPGFRAKRPDTRSGGPHQPPLPLTA